MTSRILSKRVAVLLMVPAAVAVPVGLSVNATAATTKTIKLSGVKMSPSKLTIHKGDKVRFVWADGGKTGGHTLVGPHVKVSLRKSGSKLVSFKTKGSFTYVCTIHPGMKTVIKVK